MNTKDNKWMTPLHRACASGSVVSSVLISQNGSYVPRGVLNWVISVMVWVKL